jgi:hypothetical protein
MRGIPQDLQVFSGELVSSQQSFDIPVSPVKPVINDTQCKDMWDFRSTQDLMSVSSIKVCILNVIEMCVCKEDFVAEVIDGQSIWPNKFVLIQNDASEVRSIQPDSRNEGMMTPVSEEETSNSGMDSYCSWISHP